MLDRIVPSRSALLFSLATIGIAFATGCTGETFLRIFPKPGPVRVTGTGDGAATVVPRLDEELLVPGPFGIAVPNAAARQIVAIDLGNSAVSPIADIEGVSASDVISSPDWVAWLDRSTETLQVLNRVTNARFSFDDINSKFDGNGYDTTIKALNGDRVVIHRPVGGPPDSTDWPYELVVLNLRTGERISVADSWYLGTCALDGDWLALINQKNVQVKLLGLEHSGNVDLVNLATNQRTRIASDLRISGSDPAVFIADGQVIWQEFKPGGFASRIRTYDIATAKLSTLIEDFASRDEDKMLSDARDGRLLITRIRGNFLTPGAIAILSQPIGGSDLNVLGQYDTVPAGWYMPEAKLSDGFALWTDPASGRLTAHNFASGKNRTLVLP